MKAEATGLKHDRRQFLKAVAIAGTAVLTGAIAVASAEPAPEPPCNQGLLRLDIGDEVWLSFHDSEPELWQVMQIGVAHQDRVAIYTFNKPGAARDWRHTMDIKVKF